MKCPLCSVDLVMTERHGVEIDYCPKCRGVWLDRGELDKIIDQATGPTVQPEPDERPAPQPRVWQEPYRKGPVARGYVTRYGHAEGPDYSHVQDRAHHKRGKRKSFLAELFDFD